MSAMPRPPLSLSSIQGIAPALTTPSCSRLSPVSASATAAPHARGSHVAPQGSASTRLGCFSSSRPFQAATCRANAFPDHPRQIPSIAPAAGEEENPSYLALRVPQRQRRRLPVTPLPPASYRHRLPQQPANCSATTRPLIG